MYIYNTNSILLNNINAINVTAIQKGSFLYAYNGKNKKSDIKLINSSVYGTGYVNNVKFGGLVASIEGNSNLYIKDFNGGWLNGGKGVFTLNNESTIDINGINISDFFGNNNGGVLLTSYDEKIGSKFHVNNGIFKNIVQYSKYESSSFLWSTENIDIMIKNEGSSKIELNKVELNNIIYEENPVIVICNRGITTSENSNNFIKYEKGIINLNEATISTISTCTENLLCDKIIDTINELIDIGPFSNLTMTNNLIYDFNGFKGINAKYPSYITIDNLTVQNCYFDMGFITIDSHNEIYGYYTINNSLFDFNFGMRGTILHIDEIDEKAYIIFNNSTFNFNFANTYGGIVYSTSKSTNKYVSFIDCNFIKTFSSNGNRL
eukprot:jgi/Orpsp1_1/1181870/evm.model.c7180000078932.1